MKLYYAIHKFCSDLHYIGESEQEIEEQHEQFPECRSCYEETDFVECESAIEAARFAMQLCFD